MNIIFSSELISKKDKLSKKSKIKKTKSDQFHFIFEGKSHSGFSTDTKKQSRVMAKWKQSQRLFQKEYLELN